MSSRLFDEIRSFVRRIPEGKVLTYGDISKALGIGDARVVGWALHGNMDRSLPCHRVVKKDGWLAISYKSEKDPILKSSSKSDKGFNFVGADEQRELLLKEGVAFIEKYRVDLESCLWKAHA